MSIQQMIIDNIRLLPIHPTIPITLSALFGNKVNVKVWEQIFFDIIKLMDQDFINQNFITCFPISTPSQSKEFKSKLFKYFEVLKKSDGSCLNSIIFRKSDLDDFRGQRFERLSLALTNDALLTYYSPSIENIPLVETFKLESKCTKLKELFTSEMKSVKDECERIDVCKQQWKDAKDRLDLEIISLQQQQKEYQAQFGPLDSFKTVVDIEQNNLNDITTFHDNNWQRFHDWTEQKSQIDLSQFQNYTLDGKEMQIQLPKQVSKTVERNLALNSSRLYSDGQLDIAQYMDTWAYVYKPEG
ncbi:hypothetical protein BC833DRAFT_616827 [Globomyces pollinis-pini]|nr:hypothetical protein BC833DRAFT_616827 [Globomyces pollinis-pini]